MLAVHARQAGRMPGSPMLTVALAGKGGGYGVAFDAEV
jgi:hypothetical protein